MFNFRKTNVERYDILIEKGFNYLKIGEKNEAVHCFNMAKDEIVLDPSEAFLGLALSKYDVPFKEIISKFSESIVNDKDFQIAVKIASESNKPFIDIADSIIKIASKKQDENKMRLLKRGIDNVQYCLDSITELTPEKYPSFENAIYFLEKNPNTFDNSSEIIKKIKYAFGKSIYERRLDIRLRDMDAIDGYKYMKSLGEYKDCNRMCDELDNVYEKRRWKNFLKDMLE